MMLPPLMLPTETFKEYFLPWINFHEPIKYVFSDENLLNPINKLYSVKEFFTFIDNEYKKGFKTINIKYLRKSGLFEDFFYFTYNLE